MKPITRLVPLAATFLVAGLAGCAAAPAKTGDHDHATMGPMDMQAHCGMHRKMMSGKSPAEHQAMMQEHMRGMAPDMRQRMRPMHDQCK